MARVFRTISRPSDTIRKLSSRLYVELVVSAEDIRRGSFARVPGPHLFGGLWYGKRADCKKSFGKLIARRGFPVGKVTGRPSAYLLRKLAV